MAELAEQILVFLLPAVLVGGSLYLIGRGFFSLFRRQPACHGTGQSGTKGTACICGDANRDHSETCESRSEAISVTSSRQ